VKIVSIGGGPAGLYLGILMKQIDPSHEITVIERNRPEDTFGFGVVFSERTLGNIQHGDTATYEEIARHCQLWDPIEVRTGGKTIRCGGNGFSAIARKRLLYILQERAARLGVDLRFQTEASPPSAYKDYDLILAADGANSMVRRTYTEQFRPTMKTGKAKYIWFGTTQHFDSLTFLFEENEHGVFSVHAYPFDDKTSTFIVETDEQSWRNAGLDRNVEATIAPGVSDLASMAYCQKLFAKHLDGHELIVNNSKWLNFRTLKNETWHYENMVLMGDAAHTAHFSVGSGTKMAMEDAIALSQALKQHSDIPTALVEYERVRRPEVDRIQRAARPSLAWWESFRYYKHLDPEQFTFNFLSRNPRVTYNNLMRRDAQFVTLVDQWFTHKVQPSIAQKNKSDLVAPFTLPFQLGDTTFKNRIAVSLPLQKASVNDRQHNVGLLLIEMDRTHAEDWQIVSRLVESKGDTRIGLYLSVPEQLAQTLDKEALHRLRNDYATLARIADSKNLDLLELSHHVPLEVVSAVRKAWPREKPLVARISSPDQIEEVLDNDESIEAARLLKHSGCDLISITTGAKSTKDNHLTQRLLSDRIRNEVRIPTMTIGGITTADEINTMILGARADLCLVDSSDKMYSEQTLTQHITQQLLDQKQRQETHL